MIIVSPSSSSRLHFHFGIVRCIFVHIASRPGGHGRVVISDYSVKWRTLPHFGVCVYLLPCDALQSLNFNAQFIHCIIFVFPVVSVQI